MVLRFVLRVQAPPRLLICYLCHTYSSVRLIYYLSACFLNCSVTFFPNHCVFQEIETQRTLDTRREYGDLYHLETSVSQVACVSSTFLRELHRQFGHPTLLVLRKKFMNQVKCRLLNVSHVKWDRVLYALRVNKRIGNLFELVHFDIQGPCHVSSTLDFKYFITFVDDFSRVRWLYLMKIIQRLCFLNFL